MIFIFTIVLFSFSDCTPYGAVSDNGGDKSLLGVSKTIAHGVEQYEQKNYLNYHHEQYRDGHNDKNDDYGNIDKTDIDVKEYNNVPKCDKNIEDCKDGQDCYDKTFDGARYDNCKNQYGDEGRYYNLDNRNSVSMFQENDSSERYEREYYDDHNDSDDYDVCRNGEIKYKENKIYTEKDWINERNRNVTDKNIVGLGRRDVEHELIRPCALDDRQCIRKYLAMNSKCKPVYGPIPDPLYLKRNTVYFPLANLTVIRTRLRVTGLASIKISEFYVNKITKNLVIALDFEKLNQTSPRVYFRYQRTAKESLALYDYASDEYKSGTFTAVIPKIPHLRLDLAEVHADIDDLVPTLIVGPKAFESKDPDVVASVATFFANLPLITREFFLFQSQLFTAIYIQENICDFGLKLTSV